MSNDPRTNEELHIAVDEALKALDAVDFLKDREEWRRLISVKVAAEHELERRAKDALRPAGYQGTMRGTRCRIINRLGPCRCGCQGQDPWHKETYWRVVTVTGEGEGTVRMPYSTQPVRVTLDKYYWYVDRDSIVYDK